MSEIQILVCLGDEGYLNFWEKITPMRFFLQVRWTIRFCEASRKCILLIITVSDQFCVQFSLLQIPAVVNFFFGSGISHRRRICNL